jgi:glutaredoxin
MWEKGASMNKKNRIPDRLRILFIGCLIFLFAAGIAVAETHIWVDDAGVTHISDRPPASESLELQKVPEVVLYITSWCRYCKQARNFLRSRGIPFTEYDIEKDKRAAIRKKRLDKQKGVPFAIIYGQKVNGFSKELYEKALRGRKGRPK